MLLPCAATEENTLSVSRWNRLKNFGIDFHVENFPRSEAVTLIVVTKIFCRVFWVQPGCQCSGPGYTGMDLLEVCGVCASPLPKVLSLSVAFFVWTVSEYHVWYFHYYFTNPLHVWSFIYRAKIFLYFKGRVTHLSKLTQLKYLIYSQELEEPPTPTPTYPSPPLCIFELS